MTNVGIQLTADEVTEMERRLTQLHEFAVAARDRAQSAIIEVRQTKEWLTVLQIRAMQAEKSK